jgi:hypothetical protein
LFQSHVFFEDNSYYRFPRKRAWLGKETVPLIVGLITNSMALAEGEGGTATCLGQRPSGGGKYIKPRSLKIIHRVPSVEGATATCLGNLILARGCLGGKEKFEKTLRMGYLIVITKPQGG